MAVASATTVDFQTSDVENINIYLSPSLERLTSYLMAWDDRQTTSYQFHLTVQAYVTEETQWAVFAGDVSLVLPRVIVLLQRRFMLNHSCYIQTLHSLSYVNGTWRRHTFSPDLILCGWLGSRHQLTNSHTGELGDCFLFVCLFVFCSLFLQVLIRSVGLLRRTSVRLHQESNLRNQQRENYIPRCNEK